MEGTREALEAERRTTLNRLRALSGDFDRIVESSRDSNADDEHDPEGATIAFERSQVDALIQQARTHLCEVDAALGRLSVGDYGTCEHCHRPIPQARLEARPTARKCVTCQER